MESKLLEHFSGLPEPRMANKCRHGLIDIVMIGICATIAQAESWEDIALFGENKQDWLKQWLALPNGIPSADTFKRVFELLDRQAFERCFRGWVSEVFKLTAGQVVGIDGKMARGTCDKTGQASLYLVSAWATDNRLTLGQVNVPDKSNEISAIPDLLEVLAIQGCIVTLDAIGCQTEIVQQIREQKADYAITVKGNQPTLLGHLKAAFAAQDALGFSGFSPDYCETRDTRHGRIEQRQCWVLPGQATAALGWLDCQTLVRITRTTQRGSALPTHKTHYYISSLPTQASLLLAVIRAHWGIENQCHWVLDVVFHEDACRTRTRFADDNLALLRKIALNLLRQHPSKGSLKGKRYRAALNDDFLLEVMQSSFNLMP